MKPMLYVSLIAVFISVSTSVFAQGSLTPPGPPAPTMKTLNQVESRTAIMSIPTNITQSGSYYLLTNMVGTSGQSGISISADNVTIDMNGCHLQGASGTLNGIQTVGLRKYVAIRDGIITAWGSKGIDLSTSVGGSIENVVCASNANDGVALGDGMTVYRCIIEENGDDAIEATGNNRVENTMIRNNMYGFYSTGENNAIQDCTISGNNLFGIRLGGKDLVQDCLVANNGDNCITVTGNDGVLRDNVCKDGGSGSGISVSGNGWRVENNHITDSVVGLNITGNGNRVANNTVLGNTNNYLFSLGNQLNLLISEIPEVIQWPCSIKLAGTLKDPGTVSGADGITISNNNVTLDLDGHSLIGTVGSGNGLQIGTSARTVSNVVVRNGTIAEWYTGIEAYYATGLSFSDLIINSNSENGIRADADVNVSKCVIRNNATGDAGLMISRNGVVKDSIFTGNSTGVSCSRDLLIEDCLVSSNTWGIVATLSASILNCTLDQNKYCAIVIGMGGGRSIIRGNTCSYSTDGFQSGIYLQFGHGIRVEDNNLAGNYYGINVIQGGNHIIKNNTLEGNTEGIVFFGSPTNVLVVKNTVIGNVSSNYVINTSQNSVGEILNVKNSIISNASPWANFSM